MRDRISNIIRVYNLTLATKFQYVVRNLEFFLKTTVTFSVENIKNINVFRRTRVKIYYEYIVKKNGSFELNRFFWVRSRTVRAEYILREKKTVPSICGHPKSRRNRVGGRPIKSFTKAKRFPITSCLFDSIVRTGGTD